jgi:hypothetical protein
VVSELASGELLRLANKTTGVDNATIDATPIASAFAPEIFFL